jgi:poly-gamma-glutamate synthesis protein (capsule biosynthesis protein)
MKIAAVGDIMPGGVLYGRDGLFVSDKVLAILRDADIRVGTLETAVGNEPSFYEEKMARKADVIYVKDDDLKRLAELDINVVSLANNHFFDLGPEGAIHAIELLDSMGIKHCGAGRNLEEASRPVVFEKEGKSIAFLAFCDWRDETVGWCPFATESEPGVNPMYDDYVEEQIAKYKKQYDYVAVIPHWGKEHTFVTTKDVYALANKMIRAGADMVFGGHTHRIQPVLKKNGAVVAYSMGNFFFPDRLITKPRSTYYPDAPVDYRSLPVTDGYPFVDRVTLKIWRSLARIGEIVVVNLNSGKESVKTSYVELSRDNHLDTTSLPFSTRLALGWQKTCLTIFPYSQYAATYSKLKSTVKRIIRK